ncbi:hypothetical protein LTR36_006949 [Oleoguttula mirabilis]|uniref:Uncharacterized protein n=1 Tax=Oleoguttula mirabilis TaxID=1507867 RepID=A0AAV9JBK0_9PEZI|nr:hypothetical protein LTR36_006949 [Oleoguttula mirabilis]
MQPPDSGRSGRSTAPVYSVPHERIVSIEHPCIVKNFDNGFKSLGGEPQLKHVLEHKVGDSLLKVDGRGHVFPEPVAGVSLRPSDPLAKKLASKGLETRNVLVKVTLPKWTGRKRKRGSNAPFTLSSPPEPRDNTIRAPELLRRMRDTEGAYSIQPVGMIRETHKFRSQPDFQMHTSGLPIMAELRDHAMKPSYVALQRLRVDLKPGSRDVLAFPLPPNFAPSDQPYPYEYQQDAQVTFTTDEQGNATSENARAGTRKRQVGSLAADAEEVPTGPPADLKSSYLAENDVLRAVEQLRELLDKRPMVTRQVALCALPELKQYAWPKAIERVGYTFSAGPFRDTLIKYGVDPRSDPKYRFYQLLTFNPARKLKANGAGRAEAVDGEARSSYIFDGTAARANGKTYQVCDVTDPLVYDVFRTDNIRTECDVHQWGWFHSGTIAKARVIMRDKTVCFSTGETTSDEDYRALLTMPDDLAGANVEDARFDPSMYSAKVVKLGAEYRIHAKYHAGLKRPPRGAPDTVVSDFNTLYGSVERDVDAEGQYGEYDVDLDDRFNAHERTWDAQGGDNWQSNSVGVDVTREGTEE